MAVTATLSVGLNGKHTATVDLGSEARQIAENLALAFTNGTGSDQVDRAWADQRTLAASATEDLDLAGVLLDAFGAAITFVKIKAILIFAAVANTNDVQITRPASNGVPLFLAAADGIAIKPGGVFVWACPGAGVAVTAATGDLLTITNSGAGTGVTYDAIILGTSA